MHDRTPQKSYNHAHSPLKAVLRKFGDRYQSYCTTYKTRTMTTCHGRTGHTGNDRDLSSPIEDTRGMDIGPNNDNESTQFRYYDCFWRIRTGWPPLQPLA